MAIFRRRTYRPRLCRITNVCVLPIILLSAIAASLALFERMTGVLFSVRRSESAAHKINHIEAIVAWFENSLLRASPVIRETSALSHCQTLWVYRTRGMATSSHRECLIMTYGFISAAYTAARLCRRLYSQCLCDLFCSQPLRRRLFYSIVWRELFIVCSDRKMQYKYLTISKRSWRRSVRKAFYVQVPCSAESVRTLLLAIATR